jgi:hypothetical protein
MPLEYLLRHDRERDDAAELQSRDRDHRHECVAKRMAEMYGPVGETARTRELDVIGAQHFEHLRAHEAHHERHLEERERDRRQDQRFETAFGQQSRRPPAKRHRLPAAE